MAAPSKPVQTTWWKLRIRISSNTHSITQPCACLSPVSLFDIFSSPFKKSYLIFISLAPPRLGHGMWDLVPRSGMEPRTPALGAQNSSLDHQDSSSQLSFISIVSHFPYGSVSVTHPGNLTISKLKTFFKVKWHIYIFLKHLNYIYINSAEPPGEAPSISIYLCKYKYIQLYRDIHTYIYIYMTNI